MATKSLLSAILFVFAARQGAAAFSAVSPTSIRAPTSFGNARDPTPSLYPRIATSMSRTATPSMMSSASGDEVATGDGDEKIEGRKKRVVVGYKAMTISYLAVALMSAAEAGMSVSLLRTIVGYIAMPAGISYIMIGAAENDRLSSDTYKRLNLALLEYGLVGLAAVALGGNLKRNCTMALSFALSVINSTKGYAYGVLGWDKTNSETTLLKDLTNGTQETMKGFISIPHNLKSAGYMAATTEIASITLLKLSAIFKVIRANSIAPELAPLLARFNRLALFTLVLYTLKDAANRDRLGGTTFIQLNYLASLAMGMHCALHAGGAFTGASGVFIGASAFFAAFFALNGMSSYMKNHYA